MPSGDLLAIGNDLKLGTPNNRLWRVRGAAPHRAGRPGVDLSLGDGMNSDVRFASAPRSLDLAGGQSLGFGSPSGAVRLADVDLKRGPHLAQPGQQQHAGLACGAGRFHLGRGALVGQ
jgi:hypothetical protein